MRDSQQIKTLYNGAVALTTVIILTSILMIAGTTIVLTSIDLRKSTKNNNSFIQAEINFDSCIEESVQRLKYNPGYTGTFTVTMINGSCEAIVSNDVDPMVKILEIISTSETSTFSDTVRVDTSVYPFQVL